MFASRCQLYAEENGVSDSTVQSDDANRTFWDRMEPLIAAAEEGVTPPSIDLNWLADVATRSAKPLDVNQAHRHPLVEGGRAYCRLVDRWFEAHMPQFDASQEQRARDASLRVVGEEAAAEVRVGEAAEVIRWYQYQIPVRFAQGLLGDEQRRSPGRPTIESTYNGHPPAAALLKLGLLAIDRSLAGWALLRQSLPVGEKDALPLVLKLMELRLIAERIFPQARAFLRPGLDTEAVADTSSR